MKNQTIIVVIVAIVIVLAIVIFSMQKAPTKAPVMPQTAQQGASTNTTAQQPDTSAPTNQPTSASTASPIEIAMNAQNKSGEMGKAILTDVDGKTTKVEIQITGEPQGVSQPAHIHMGSCANLGAVKYPLTFPMNGTSSTTLDMPLSQLLSQLPLAINVHKSSADIGTYVSCGDITASGSAASATSQPAATPAPAPKQTAPAPSSNFPGY